MSEPKKVVYLLGAGATNAEKMFACSHEKYDLDDEGLTNKYVSRRVLEQMWRKKGKASRLISKYGLDKRCLERPPGVEKDVDIEFLITLIESNKTEESENDAKLLRKYFRRDILNKLKFRGKEIKPRLYPALLEWQKFEKNEEVLGYLTLNYDSLFETALIKMGYKIDYGLSIENSLLDTDDEKLLLKLHGSFDWFLDSETSKIRIERNGEQKGKPQWIPPGLIKEYADYPYNLLFGKAREILIECDILRVIGCSLSSNDWGLISLIFGTQKLRLDGGYSIEIIASEKTYRDKLQKRLGFMLKFADLFYDVPRYIELGLEHTENPFRDWLVFNSKNMSSEKLKKTKYLKNLES